MRTSTGVLKPVGDVKALRKSVSSSGVARSSGSLVAWKGRERAVVRREVRAGRAAVRQRADLVGTARSTTPGAVHLGAAEVVGGHVFAEHRL